MLSPLQIQELEQYHTLFSNTEVRAYIDYRKRPSEAWTVRLSVARNTIQLQRRFYSLESALEFVEDARGVFPTVRLVEKKSKRT